MWDEIIESIRPTMLPAGQANDVIIVGAGASGLMCSLALQKKGVRVTILEARDRTGGRLYTDKDGLDIGGHWIHGGGPDAEVAEYAAANVDQFELNPVRALCDEFGIATKLTDGDSAYIGESEAGVREIMFFQPDGTPLPDDGPQEEELWDTYEAIVGKVHQLEEAMRANGEVENVSMSLADAFARVTSSIEPPLTDRQRLYLQWHLETEFGGDYAEDPEALSFYHYDGGAKGDYRVFAGGDRVLVGGYSALIGAMEGELAKLEPKVTIELQKAVAEIDYSAPNGVTLKCVDGSIHAADAIVVTCPVGVLKRPAGSAGHVAMCPPLPERKQSAIARSRMGCLNKLFLVFDACHWPKEQYTFAYINEKPDQYPSMIVNLMVSHGLPILTCMVGGGAGRAFERRSTEENVEWAMVLVRKLFGESVPPPVRAVQTAWDQDPYSYGAYACMGKGMRADDMVALGEPVDSRLFFAGEGTNPMFWGCVHGALVSGLREAARISGDASLLQGGGKATAALIAKRAKHVERVKAKAQAVKTKHQTMQA